MAKEEEAVPEGTGESCKAFQLGPPLGIIPESVSSRKLEAFRVQYQKFRAGESSGAKGEVTRCTHDEMHPSAYAGRSNADSSPSDVCGGSPIRVEATTYRSMQHEDSQASTSSASRADAPRDISFSVKNTFVHIDDGTTQRNEEEPSVLLPPSLPIIPESISPEKLDAYRTDYQKF